MHRTMLLTVAALVATAHAEVVPDRDNRYFYDTRSFADNQTYDAGNGNAYSGMGHFGSLYDLQLADDFTTTSQSHIISRVITDTLCFFGGTPAGGLQVDIWTDTGAGPGVRISSQTAYAFGESWADTIFGLYGRRLTADVYFPLAPNTSYYIMIQPIDLTSGGDWYYQIRDSGSRIGGDAYLRDGGRAAGGYGTTAWTGCGDFGFGVGDVGMALYQCPSPGAFAAFGAGAIIAMRRRPARPAAMPRTPPRAG